MLDIIDETGLMGLKHGDMPKDPNMELCVDQGELMTVEKLNYLMITRLDI